MLLVVHGADTYRVRKQLNALLERYRQVAPSSFQMRSWEEPDAEGVWRELETRSLFSDKRFLILKGWLNFPEGEEFFRVHKERICKDGDSIVVLVHEGEIPKKSEVLVGAERVYAFPPLSEAQFEAHVRKLAQAAGAALSPKALKLLSAACRGDLWRAEQEVKKLAANPQPIGESEVLSLVRMDREAHMFRTLEAWAQRNTKKALELLRLHEKQGDSSLSLLPLFVSQVRDVLAIKELQERGVPAEQMGQMGGINPRAVFPLSKIARQFSLAELRGYFSDLFRIDRALKLGRAEGFFPLEFLIARRGKRAS